MFPELFREIGRIRKIQAERDFRNRHFGMQKPARLPHSQIQQIFAGRTGNIRLQYRKKVRRENPCFAARTFRSIRSA